MAYPLRLQLQRITVSSFLPVVYSMLCSASATANMPTYQTYPQILHVDPAEDMHMCSCCNRTLHANWIKDCGTILTVNISVHIPQHAQRMNLCILNENPEVLDFCTAVIGKCGCCSPYLFDPRSSKFAGWRGKAGTDADHSHMQTNDTTVVLT